MNALVTTNAQLPAHLASRMGAPSSIAEAMSAGISTGYKRISIRGGRFRIREGSTETVLPGDTLDAIIVGASSNMTKSFYKGAYNPKAEEKAPDCYSNDGIRPAKDAIDPQAQLCATCEHNQWGSKVTEDGAKMKACADQKRLAIISAGDDSAEPEVYGFTVTPAALTDFRNYANRLAAKGWPPEFVITKLSFDTSASYPKIKFEFGGFVEEHMIPNIDSLVGSTHVREIIGETAQVATIVSPPKVTKPAAVRAKQPEPEVEEVEVEIIPAPTTKSKGFGAGAPAKAAVVPEPPKEPPVAQSSKLADDIQSILNSMQEEEDE